MAQHTFHYFHFRTKYLIFPPNTNKLWIAWHTNDSEAQEAQSHKQMRELKEERKKTKGKYKKYPASLHTMFCTARTDTRTEETCLKTVFVSASATGKGEKREVQSCWHTWCFISLWDGLTGETGRKSWASPSLAWSPAVHLSLQSLLRGTDWSPAVLLPFQELPVIRTFEDRNRAILKH